MTNLVKYPAYPWQTVDNFLSPNYNRVVYIERR